MQLAWSRGDGCRAFALAACAAATAADAPGPMLSIGYCWCSWPVTGPHTHHTRHTHLVCSAACSCFAACLARYALVEYGTKQEAQAAIDEMDGKELLTQVGRVSWGFMRFHGV